MSLVTQALDRYRADRAFQIVEASEWQRERLIQELGRQGAALLSDSSDLVSASERGAVAAEHLVGEVSRLARTTEDLGEEFSRMAAVADWALPAMVEHLASTAERLGGVEQMLANPAETAAAEFYRRGTHALANEWWEEAEADLSEAVRLYPYNPRTWLNFGIARQRAGSGNISAAEAFARCARYGASTEAALAARAVLLTAPIYRSADRQDASRDLLGMYAEKIETCAELHLSLAVHHGSHEHLISALVLAPRMAIDARVADVPRLDEAATAAGAAAGGVVQRLRSLERSLTDLIGVAREAGLTSIQSAPAPVALPDHGVDALLLADAFLPVLIAGVRRLMGQIGDEHAQRVVACERETRSSDDARTDVADAVDFCRAVESRVPDLIDRVVAGSQAVEEARRSAEKSRNEKEELRKRVEAQAMEPVLQARRIAKEHAESTDWMQSKKVRLGQEFLRQAQEGRQRESRRNAEIELASASNFLRRAEEEARDDFKTIDRANASALQRAEAEAKRLIDLVNREVRTTAANLDSAILMASRQLDKDWQELCELAPADDGEAQRRIQDCRRRDSQALENDLAGLIIEPARRRVLDAQGRAAAAGLRAEQAAGRVAATEAAMAHARPTAEAAERSAASPPRVVPFDLA